MRPQQKDLVASNLYSIAQSKFDPNAYPRAVYAGKELVGFLMYNVWETKEKIREASIYRFMIDVKHQGRATAVRRRAGVDEIKATPGVKKVSIGYMLENAVAKQFYASFGFVEVGRDEDGEIEAELTL